jgi:L-malate glycosyltransferase
MRVTVIGRTYLLSVNRRKWRYVHPDITLTLITPTGIRHPLRQYAAQPSQHWPHILVPAYFTDRLSAFVFAPGLFVRALRRASPELIQIDEEPASLAMLETLITSRRLGSRLIFLTWENLVSRHPFPFSFTHRLALRFADGAIAGNEEAALRLREAGFRKPVAVIPQLGVEPDVFVPDEGREVRDALHITGFSVGYIGRLVVEKGVLHLLQAMAGLKTEWTLVLVGRGPAQPELLRQAVDIGIDDHLRWIDTVDHGDVPRYLNAMDALVLPSLTTPRWKEQFGHVLIEAMSCGVPVVGSSSGAIPEVVGDAGLIYPEGQIDALRARLQQLSEDPALRSSLARSGRTRVLAHFTNQRVAERTTAFWREVCPCA